MTKSLLFVSVTHLNVNGLPAPPAWAAWGDPDAARKAVYILDKSTGELLHVLSVEGGAAPPMTCLHAGRQYVVVGAGGPLNSELVAFALPK